MGRYWKNRCLDVNVNGEDERGLLGIAVSKNSTVGKTYVFLFYTEAEPGTQVSEEDDDDNREEQTSIGDGGQPIGNRLYRYELSENGSRLVNPKLLLDLPYLPGPAHNGGAITIGPDDNIYLAMGELTPTSYGQGDIQIQGSKL